MEKLKIDVHTTLTIMIPELDVEIIPNKIAPLTSTSSIIAKLDTIHKLVC